MVRIGIPIQILNNDCNCDLCIVVFRWQSAKSKGRQQELLYCSKNFLKRTTLWDIEVRKDMLMHGGSLIGKQCCQMKDWINIKDLEVYIIYISYDYAKVSVKSRAACV